MLMVLITIGSLIFAAIMGVVAWRVTREERRRSEARVATLAAEIHRPIEDRFTTIDRFERPSVVEPVQAFSSQDLFAAPAADTDSAGKRWGLALAAGGLVIATVAAAAIVFSGESPSASTRVGTATPATPQAPLALELVALAHERNGDALTVRGEIRNPSAGVEMDNLVAVVFLFNRDGGFLASGRAAVESTALIPGGESAFTVTVPASGDVGRYRVSFRSGDRVISHVDRRNGS